MSSVFARKSIFSGILKNTIFMNCALNFVLMVGIFLFVGNNIHWIFNTIKIAQSDTLSAVIRHEKDRHSKVAVFFQFFSFLLKACLHSFVLL